MVEQADIRIGKAGDVARILGVHVNKVYEMAQADEIPQLRRIGPELRFDMDEIAKWMRRREDGGES